MAMQELDEVFILILLAKTKHLYYICKRTNTNNVYGNSKETCNIQAERQTP